MEWVRYVLFAVFAILTAITIYFAFRFNNRKLTEREINLYSNWFVRIWFRYRVGFAIMTSLVFGLMSLGALLIKI